MPTVARIKNEQGIFHIYSRGNNYETIFRSVKDRIEFLGRIKRFQKEYDVHIVSYCLMDTHFHMLIYCNGYDISKFMQKFLLSYTIYFNKQHNRRGHLFQNRFGSQLIESNRQLAICSRYIHRNPVRANMVDDPRKYNWSSCNVFLGQKDEFSIVKPDMVLKVLSKNKGKAIKEYVKLLDLPDDKKLVDEYMEDYQYENNDRTYKKTDYTPDKIIDLICNKFTISKDFLTRKYNHENTFFQNLCQYLMSFKCQVSLKEIGSFFGVHASSISNNIKRFVNKLNQSKSQESIFLNRMLASMF